MSTSGPIVRFGRFEVVSRIGIGGMGEVFHARVRGFGRESDVALKLIRPEYADDARFRQMFLAESEIGALLDHPNIARVVDYGEVDGVLYLATELVDGVNLHNLTSNPIPLPIAGYVVEELLEALAYVHELRDAHGQPLGLVHRDVSLTNVLLSRSGEVKLSDFGVHKVTSVAEETAPDEFKGKPAFMAPEQLPGGAGVDHRADIFAVGVVLHMLTMGRGPFSDVSAWLADDSPLSLDDGPLADVIERALAPEPEGRFASARELLAALRKRVPRLPDAQAQLGQFVSGRAPAERPLGAIERAIMSEFDVSEPSLVYAPDPTTHRLWVLDSEAHSLDPVTSVDGRVLQTADYPESVPTSPRIDYQRTRADATLPAGLVPSQPARDDAGELTPAHGQRLHEAGELTPVQPRVIFDPGEQTTVDAPRLAERLDPTPPVVPTGVTTQTPMPPPLGTPPPPPLAPRPSLESLAASSLSRVGAGANVSDNEPTKEYDEPPLTPLEPYASEPIELTEAGRGRRSLPRTSLIVLLIAGVTALLVLVTRSKQTLPPDPRPTVERDPLVPPTLPPSRPARPPRPSEPVGESSASVTVRSSPPAPRVRVKSRSDEARGVGYLTLDTEPWASVYLGTRRLGTTPFVRVAVPSGRVQLTLDLQDRGQRVQRSVDIEPGEVKRLALRLR